MRTFRAVFLVIVSSLAVACSSEPQGNNDDGEGDYGAPAQTEDLVGASLVPKGVDRVDITRRHLGSVNEVSVTDGAGVSKILRAFRKRNDNESPPHCMGAVTSVTFMEGKKKVASMSSVCGFGTLTVGSREIEIRITSNAILNAVVPQ